MKLFAKPTRLCMLFVMQKGTAILFNFLFWGVVFSASTCVNAAIFTVTDTNDSVKITSLRGAVIAANRIGRDSTIILGMAHGQRNNQQSQWIYRLTIAGADEEAAQTGDLNITRGKLTIIGASPGVVIDATGLGDRIFQVSSNAQLTLKNLVIKGGSPSSGNGFASGEPGGAIFNAGTLFLENCVITNNASGGGQYLEGNGGGTGGGDGGGIYNSGTLLANDCGIVGNLSGAGVDGAQGGNGGGIRNDGLCYLTRCIVNGNQAGAGGGPAGNAIGAGGSGGGGGGMFNLGTMILNACIVGTNAAGLGASGGDPQGFIILFSDPGGPGGNGGSGGGIYNLGKMEIDFSVVYGNNSGSGGGGDSFGQGGNPGAGGNGGGIFNAGELNLNTSTISDNLCGNGAKGGDGYFGSGASGGAGGNGGGICNAGSIFLIIENPLNPFVYQAGYYSGSLTLTSCTIALNASGSGGNGGNGLGFSSTTAASGGNGGDGGGVWNEANGIVETRNTLVALNLINIGGKGGTNQNNTIFPGSPPPTPIIGNAGADGLGFDVAGNFTSQGFNLISTADYSIGFINGMNADQVGSNAKPIDPLLAPLQMNGGFTPTHALLWGSPAIDQGNCFGVQQDQRGHYRPYDYASIPNAVGGDGSDIGAFELDTP